jgi:hypothetical protein
MTRPFAVLFPPLMCSPSLLPAPAPLSSMRGVPAGGPRLSMRVASYRQADDRAAQHCSRGNLTTGDLKPQNGRQKQDPDQLHLSGRIISHSMDPKVNTPVTTGRETELREPLRATGFPALARHLRLHE